MHCWLSCAHGSYDILDVGEDVEMAVERLVSFHLRDFTNELNDS